MSKASAWINERFPLDELIGKHLTAYPVAKTLNAMWNFGFLLIFFLLIQVITGIFLAMYYVPHPDEAFDSVNYIVTQVNFGWLVRSLHQVGATFFFILLYLHIGRGIYYGSYKKPRELVWMIGLTILLLSMAQSTTGYILPWGQLSFWAATVVTSFLGAIPLVGNDLVILLRGDFAVGGSTLGRFFSVHVTLIPIGLISLLVLLHISALHKVGGNNPDGIDVPKTSDQMIPFHPYYTAKDFFFGALVLLVFFYFVFFQPDFFNEPLNNEPANPFQTPAAIVPEWYFSPWFAILKSIPNKLFGLLALVSGLGALFFLPYLDRSPVRSARYRPVMRVLTILFFADFAMLGYVGFFPATGLPLILGRLGTAYFLLFFALLIFVPRFERTRPLPERLT